MTKIDIFSGFLGAGKTTLIRKLISEGYKNEKLVLNCDDLAKLPPKKTAAYIGLFLFSLLIVFRLIPFVIGLILIPAAMIVLDKKALKDVDYGLLLTCVFFFIFSGNLGRIEAVRGFFESLLSYNVTVVSSLLCQFISNVPSAILLSQFTDNYRELLMGVNIGGVGTLISSLASLITFREYTLREPYKVGHYLKVFTLLNLLFLIVLTLVGFLL